jgi:hypothetical protein
MYRNFKVSSRIPIVSFASATLLASSYSLAAPLDPSEKNVSQLFSAQVKDSFVLLADSDDASLVYYIPTRGGIAVDSPFTSAPIPRFSISSYAPTFGFWAGETLVRFGGSFSTLSYLNSLTQLEAEAKRAGLKIAPSPAKTATTKFLIGAYELSNGRWNLKDCFHSKMFYEIRSERNIRPGYKCHV